MKSDQSNSSEMKKHIHVILGPQRFERFSTLKTSFEKNSDVDVVRKCIDDMYKSLTEEKISLRPILQQQVNLLLQNDYLRSRHLVLNLSDVVNEAVHQWIQSKKVEINLHHFPFRKELTDDEQQVALVFVEKQYNYDRGLSLKDLKDNLNQMEEVKIRRILKKFVDNGLVLKSHLNEVDYYFATVP
ncbi:MAG: hypothetical protein ACXAC8_16545 [Candidatus Hodarchaeales archaeon]|jgi:hypothetical protein